jgi:hypothetical protein
MHSNKILVIMQEQMSESKKCRKNHLNCKKEFLQGVNTHMQILYNHWKFLNC